MNDLFEPVEYRGTRYRIVEPKLFGDTAVHSLKHNYLKGSQNVGVIIAEENPIKVTGLDPYTLYGEDISLLLLSIEHLIYRNVDIDEARTMSI